MFYNNFFALFKLDDKRLEQFFENFIYIIACFTILNAIIISNN